MRRDELKYIYFDCPEGRSRFCQEALRNSAAHYLSACYFNVLLFPILRR